MIYTAPFIMFLMHADPLRGKVGGGWALEIETFLGPKKVQSISVFTSLSLLPAMASIASDGEVFAQFK
jgi:hypothetical protein